jgi:hypothetical protein
MKQSFKVTKYYKNNKKISKAHGVLFMLFGWVVLGLLIYGLSEAYFYYEESSYGNDWIYEESSYGNDWIYEENPLPLDYDLIGYFSCSDYDPISLNERMNYIISKFDNLKGEYEELKVRYHKPAHIHYKFELHRDLGKKMFVLISTFNELVVHYNDNINYYEECSDITLYSKIDIMEEYISQQEDELEREYGNLNRRAEKEGYSFY